MENHLKLVSCLEKVFYDTEPVQNVYPVEGFQNEVISFQAAYRFAKKEIVEVKIESPIESRLRVRQVKSVPVHFPLWEEGASGEVLRTAPGLYPDLLSELAPYSVKADPKRWMSLWIDVVPDDTLAPGRYPVKVIFSDPEGILGEATQMVEILQGKLPEQKLIHTKWFHCDGLAQYYHVEAFSEEHWRIIENFVQCAVDNGINMILTPIHTPPLDTRVGSERLTTQLVEITVEGGEYRFDMTRLRRWIAMCKRCGVKYYEMAHLFTQWGAAHAPKIVANVDGVSKKIFGWETDAVSEEYGRFLRAYVPAIRQVLREEGIDANAYWHISDEPHEDQIPNYLAARGQVEEALKDCVIMDALSSFDFYTKGVVKCPVVANNYIVPFLEAGVKNLWSYYCCGQYADVSNMFICFPSSRNRIWGTQLFKFNICGFLQWGYNFYNSQFSDYPIDPYTCTDSDGAFPAGDPFQVYPGPDGKPEQSIRMMVTTEALQDMRAMQWLADLIGKDAVDAMIDEGLEKPVTFFEYPAGSGYLLALRHRINQAICEKTK